MKEDILIKAIKGDKKAFSKIYEEYFDGLWRYVYSRLREKQVVSDIVADSFIALYEHIGKIQHPGAVKSYLYKIAKNKMIKFYSREKTLSLSAFDLDRLNVPVKRKVKPAKEVLIKLEKILSALPENYADVLRLRFLSELKIKEVAEILGKSEGNIKVMQNRAIKKARDLIYNKYYIKC